MARAATGTVKTSKPAKAKAAKAETAEPKLKAAAVKEVKMLGRKSADMTAIVTASEVDYKSINYVELNPAETMAAIAAFIPMGVAAKTEAHRILCGVLIHYAKHGDFSKLPNILAAIERTLGASAKTAAIRFTEYFSTLRLNKGVWRKAEGFKPLFTGQGGGKGKDSEFDTAKMLEYKSPRGEVFGDFFKVGRAFEMPKPDDFLDKLASLLETGARMLKEKTEGKKVKTAKGEETVKVNHTHIDDAMFADLTAFATAHGIKTNSEGKYVH